MVAASCLEGVSFTVLRRMVQAGKKEKTARGHNFVFTFPQKAAPDKAHAQISKNGQIQVSVPTLKAGERRAKE